MNASTAQQRTALHYAASKGQRELVELLLQHGAQVRGWAACSLYAVEWDVRGGSACRCMRLSGV